MLETNKGWSTEYVMNLPLCRVRQIIELIIQDKRADMKFQTQVAEWQVKNISTMFTVAARENSQVKAILKAVKQMKLPLADEEADVIDERSFEEVVEQGAIVDIDSKEQPSFEALEIFFSTSPSMQK